VSFFSLEKFLKYISDCIISTKNELNSINYSKVFNILNVLSIKAITMHTQTKQTFLPFLVITFVMSTLYYSILLQLSLEYHQAFARCPNGTHKSPSGACEQAVPHEGLPRCPNGFHRSPSGICEAVNGGANSSNQNENGDLGGANNNNNGINNSSIKTPSSNFNVSSSPRKCDETLWDHVYNPTRLQIVERCQTVTGTIDSVKVESDGDFHIRLRLDPQFASMINSANMNGQFGDLVLEPICQNPVTQPDAIAACVNFHQNINIPPVGTHVTVTGSSVRDLDHGGWSEIHPVTSILEAP
jgi:hypothetical protein